MTFSSRVLRDAARANPRSSYACGSWASKAPTSTRADRPVGGPLQGALSEKYWYLTEDVNNRINLVAKFLRRDAEASLEPIESPPAPPTLSFLYGFIVPENQPSGVYCAYYDEAGNGVHELLTPEMVVSSVPEGAEAICPPSLATQEATPRYAGYPLLSESLETIYCDCGFALSLSQCGAVVANFKN